MSSVCWLNSTLQRVFPAGGPGGNKALALVAARGERVSFQACFSNDGNDLAQVKATAIAPEGLSVLVRRVGYVPMPHRNTDTPREEAEGWEFLPGYVPDPLFDGAEAWVGPLETCAFWVTVDVPRTAKPGRREVAVEIRSNSGKNPVKEVMRVSVEVSEVVIQKRRGFRVVHWFYADAIADRYKLELFGKDFWPMCEKYMRNCIEHGNDAMYVPVFTPPTDESKRPCQLLKVKRVRDRGGNDRFSFDWRRVKLWVELARKCGADFFEWTHFFPPRGGAVADTIYETKDGKEIPLWPAGTPGASDVYRNFLAQFLPEFKRFLDRQGVLDASYFHISDEPWGPVCLEHYRKASKMVRELAPWIRTIDAVSEVAYAREKITDIPIPNIAHVKPFLEAGVKPCFCYYCCGPRGRYINRLLDTPLTKIRMTGWVLYRLGLDGFLHWGYNFWDAFHTREPIDPFAVTDGCKWPLIPYGDTFVVYPGPDGPLDSIRWEVFAESLQDFALLQTVGAERDCNVLSPVKDFEEFPRDEKWIHATRRRLLLGEERKTRRGSAAVRETKGQIKKHGGGAQ